jgi:folate-binding protein YgfZ
MLNGLITNDMSRAGVDRLVYGAMLTPKGRMITDLRAWVKAGTSQPELVIDIPLVALEAVSAPLRKYVPPLFARWENTQSRIIGVYGPAAAAVVASVLGVEASTREGEVAWSHSGNGDVSILSTRIAGGETGFDLVVESEQYEPMVHALEATAGRFGGGPIGFATLETLRIEAGVPRFGIDMTEESMPAEVFTRAGLMENAVSFTKGCYTGQEVVVRIAHRGHVNRMLRGLVVEGGAPPEAGTSVLDASEKQVGWTTSATYSPLLERVVALVVIRREIDPGTKVRLGSALGTTAVVSTLPFQGAD